MTRDQNYGVLVTAQHVFNFHSICISNQSNLIWLKGIRIPPEEGRGEGRGGEGEENSQPRKIYQTLSWYAEKFGLILDKLKTWNISENTDSEREEVIESDWHFLRGENELYIQII